MNRIVNPDVVRDKVNLKDMKNGERDKAATEIASHLHDYTHGLTSDSITMFGIVFVSVPEILRSTVVISWCRIESATNHFATCICTYLQRL